MATRSEMAEDAGRAAKQQASAAWTEAKGRARTAVAGQQHAAAEGLGEFAAALREAARNVQGGQETSVSRVAEGVADGLERLSGTLRTKELDEMVRDVESFARGQPLAFFGAAMAAGFVAMRFLNSRETGAQGALGGRPEDDARQVASEDVPF